MSDLLVAPDDSTGAHQQSPGSSGTDQSARFGDLDTAWG